jgi:hypothetical protein
MARRFSRSPFFRRCGRLTYKPNLVRTLRWCQTAIPMSPRYGEVK